MIVEDEPLYALHLRTCLAELGHEAVGPAADAATALALFADARPDLALLDIGLRGDVDGIDLAHQLRALRPGLPLLFITAFADRATFERAKPLGPVAYLHKPFTAVSVQYAIELALQGSLSAPTSAASPAAGASATLPNPKTPWPDDLLVRDAFFVKHRHRFVPIRRADVLAIEATNNYSLLRTADGGQYVLSLPLVRCEERLAGTSFARVHRAWLVNMDRADEVLLADNTIRLGTLHVPISGGYRAELLRRLPWLT